MGKDLYKLSARAIAEKVRKGRISAVEVALASIDRISKLESRVHAWTFIDKKIFLDQSRSLDEKIRNHSQAGMLAGVPVGVKDIFNTYDMPTSMGSPLWKGFTPGNDARTVFKVRQDGGVIAGKTVTAEFAVHEPGPTRNPHNVNYYPGTSSSGSAAAVACGMVPVALGTQTAGSVIRPASYCGVYGFKPSFGLIPRTAILKTNDTLDQVGWFARTPGDIELLFDILRVKGPNHPYKLSSFSGKKWRVSFMKHPKWEYADEYAKAAFLKFRDRLSKLKNITIREERLPAEFKRAHEIHDIIYNKTLSYYFAGEYGKKHLVSRVLCGLVEKGRSITTGSYKKALSEQVRLRHRLDDLFEKKDIILTLSTSGEAPLFKNAADKPDSCLIWNLCGVPAMNIPLFKGPKGLPFGLQVVARRYSDPVLFNFVNMLANKGIIRDAEIAEVK